MTDADRDERVASRSDDSPSPGAVLRSLVASAVDADPADLDDRVEVVERGGEAERGDSDEESSPTPAGRLAEFVGAADRVVAVVPRLDADLARRLNASLASSGSGEGDSADGTSVPTDVRVVFTDAAGDRLSGPPGAVVRRALTDRGVDAYRHDGESPVAVALCDDRAVVGLAGDGGVAALLWTDDPAVCEWVGATCRRYLDAAEPVTDG